MEISKQKKLEYIRHILQEGIKGSIETEDSILLEVALIFTEDIQEEISDEPTENNESNDKTTWTIKKEYSARGSKHIILEKTEDD